LAGGILPRSVTHRTDKMGFTTPIGTFIDRNETAAAKTDQTLTAVV